MSLIHGRFKLTSSKYYMVEKAIALLEQNGFVFTHVQTSGESSSHMGEYGFDKTYQSMEEYYKNAVNDCDALRRNGMYGINWDITTFSLTNDEHDIYIDIIVSPFREDDPDFAAFCFFKTNFSTDYDEAFPNKIKELLSNMDE